MYQKLEIPQVENIMNWNLYQIYYLENGIIKWRIILNAVVFFSRMIRSSYYDNSHRTWD